VRDHEGGTRMGTAFPSRRRNRAARKRDERPRGDTGPLGSGFPGLNDGGAIFGQPHERKPGLQPGRKDRNASGKSAPRSGGSRAHGLYVHVCGPIEGPRGPRRGDAPEGRGGQQ